MLSEFLWKTFENTGNIEAYLVLKEMVAHEEVEEHAGNNLETIIGNEIATSN